MTASTSTLVIRDDGLDFNTSQTNYGPIGLGAGFIVSKIEVAGEISFEGYLTDITQWVFSPSLIGVQYGGSGYTPYDLVTAAEIDDHTWAFAQQIEPPSQDLVLAGSSGSSQILPRYAFTYTKYYQLLTKGTVADFYLSVNNVISGSYVPFRTYATFRMWYE
jgi:hypothetical protein